MWQISGINYKNLSASGGLRPPDLLPGLCPWTPLGDFRPPDPLSLYSHALYRTHPLQNPWPRHWFSASIYIAILSRMSHYTPEATLKPIRLKFTPEDVVSNDNVLVAQVRWEAAPNSKHVARQQQFLSPNVLRVRGTAHDLMKILFLGPLGMRNITKWFIIFCRKFIDNNYRKSHITQFGLGFGSLQGQGQTFWP